MKGPLAGLFATAAVLLGAVFCFAEEEAAKAAPPVLDARYVEKRDALGKEDVASHRELAKWCNDRGLVREMLKEVAIILEQAPDDAEARGLLHQVRGEGGWVFGDVAPDAWGPAESGQALSAAVRDKLLYKARNKLFKMAKRDFRFSLFTDLDTERVNYYGRLLNQHYDSLKNFFQIYHTEVGIQVQLFSERSDYLNFFKLYGNADMEHVGGFFFHNEYLSILCFYDDLYNQEDILNTARHECTHVLMVHCLQGARISNWLNEGIACFFAADGMDRTSPEPAKYFLQVCHSLRTGTSLSLKELMKFKEPLTFKHYALAWSWVAYLQSQPATQKKLGKLFAELRKCAQEEESINWDKVNYDLFCEQIADPSDLQQGWSRFVEEELAPVTPMQQYYYGMAAFECAAGWADLEPPLDAEEKAALLADSEKWLDAAAASEEAPARQKGRIWCALALLGRPRCLEYDSEEATCTVAEVLRRLQGFDKEEKQESALYIAHVAQVALRALRAACGFEEETGEPFDLVSRISACAQETPPETDQGLSEEDPGSAVMRPEWLRYQQALAEALLAEARSGYRFALEKDPINREAAQGYLFLGMDFSPQDLTAVFPNLHLIAQLDPDDQNLAALATAYAGMGKRGYAQAMFKRAFLLTLKHEPMMKFAPYIISQEDLESWISKHQGEESEENEE